MRILTLISGIIATLSSITAAPPSEKPKLIKNNEDWPYLEQYPVNDPSEMCDHDVLDNKWGNNFRPAGMLGQCVLFNRSMQTNVKVHWGAKPFVAGRVEFHYNEKCTNLSLVAVNEIKDEKSHCLRLAGHADQPADPVWHTEGTPFYKAVRFQK